MRDYKFRGKRLDNGEWVYGFGVWQLDSVNGSPECWMYTRNGVLVVVPATVGQYSTVNLKDSTELYTGDIVQHITAKWIGVIVFDDGAFRVKSKHGTWVLDKLRAERLIKLGNQTDNPELLEG